MPSAGPVSPDPSNASGTSRATSNFTQITTPTTSYFDIDYSRKPRANASGSAKNANSKKPRWMSQVKDWLSTAEPSAQAMKEQRKSTFKKHGIAPDDPQAAVKLHVSTGRVPAGATTSTSGPTPEKALKQRAANHRPRDSLGGRGSQYGSSGSSLRPSSKDHRIAPWEANE